MWPFLNNVTTTCGCTHCTPSTSICYTGVNLSCIGVNKNDTLSVALQKINALMCVPLTSPEVITALGYTPENIINKSNSYTASSTTTYPNTKALVDGLTFVKPYKVYVALLSNPSGNSIVTTVLENTLGGAISWGFGPTGIVGTLSNAFTLNKTTVQVTNGHLTVNNFRGSNSTVSTVTLVTDILPPFFPGAIDQLSIEIRVYN
jgi:hypothetical protein